MGGLSQRGSILRQYLALPIVLLIPFCLPLAIQYGNLVHCNLHLG
jgi:hypothetical protein